ncbi:MAG: hypothetical protein KQI35_00890 [Bacteroidetes bacterium]|nr:hypothetical protein [Bacteroidota bacterium]
MKKLVFLVVAIIFGFNLINAQDEEKEKDKPVYESFRAGTIIDNQTVFIPEKRTLEMVLQHRFSPMNNGISDIWGIFSPGANIRVGFNYVPIDRLQIGYGLTMNRMYSDFSAKYAILKQTRKNVVPVFVTAYGNMAIDGRSDEVFGDNYKFSNRFSYFGQLIVGRKFTDWFSFEVNGSFSHYNSVAPGNDHDKIGVGFDGMIKFSPQSALHFMYNIPLKIQSVSEYKTDNNEWLDYPQPSIGIGYEVYTGGHYFQVYITSAKGILPQHISMLNENDWTEGTKAVMVGFTMNRFWMF